MPEPPYLPGDEAWEPLPRKEREQAGSAERPWTATNNRDEDEPDGRTARRVARLIEQHKDRPFFIAAGFNKPHIHWVAPRLPRRQAQPIRARLPREPLLRLGGGSQGRRILDELLGRLRLRRGSYAGLVRDETATKD